MKTINPYEPPRAPLDTSKIERGYLRCPYCEHDFRLTWKRYWKSPFGTHTCPECGGKSKLSTGPGYWLVYLPALAISPLAVVVLAIIVSSIVAGPEQTRKWLFTPHGIEIALAGSILIPLLVFPPLDRMINTRFRKLRRMQEANAV